MVKTIFVLYRGKHYIFIGRLSNFQHLFLLCYLPLQQIAARNMKYRRLRKEELADLQKEFVQFLVSNTITAEDWEKLKKEEPTRADGLVDIFSDIVFDKIINSIKYLTYKTIDDIKTFACEEDKIHLRGLRVEGAPNLDLRENIAPSDMMANLKGSQAKIQVYRAEKGYKPDRAAELFRMLEGGALIDKTGELYQALSMAVDTSSGS